MLELNIHADVRRLERELNDFAQKQVRFATAQALNDTARAVRADLQDEFRSVFDRPVPRTLNSVRLSFATKARPEISIEIDAEPNKGTAPARYLQPQIEGGGRHLKRFERLLQAKGLMPPGWYAVPGAAAPLNQYGNVPGSFLTMLLSYFQAFGEQGYRANMTARRRRSIHRIGRSARGYRRIGGAMYFVSDGLDRTGHLHRGIWRKRGTHGVDLDPVILFVPAVSYQSRLPYEQTVRRSVDEHFGNAFRTRLGRAIATVR